MSDAARKGTASTGPRWIIATLAAVVFVLFAWSFSGLPTLESHVGSVVGETDVGAYVIVYRNFGLGHKLGNEYQRVGRGNRDMAEKHRIHHVLAASVGRVVTAAATPVLRTAGLDPRRAAFLVSPLFVVANIFLLARLLAEANPHRNPAWPFLIFYCFSLSTWLYGSMPDSWPVTSTCLLVLLLALRRPVNVYLVAIGVGVVMLNNMAILAFAGVIWLRLWQDGHRGFALVGHAAGVFGTAVVVWLGLLMALSLADPVYRPDHVWAYSVWFRDLVGADLPLTSPYVWKSIVAGLYLSSIVSNPVDSNVPPEALRDTVVRGGLGLVALIAVVGLFGLLARRWVGQIAADRPVGISGWIGRLTAPDEWPVAFALAMAVVTLVLFYPGGFTYSVLVIPCLALVLGRCLDLGRRTDRLVLGAALVLVVASNSVQVLRFREQLQASAPASAGTAQWQRPVNTDATAVAISPATIPAPVSLK